MAHITGGGITENLNRVLPKTLDARIVPGSWKVPRVFGLVSEEAEIRAAEMFRTFNMGIGFCVVVDAKDAAGAAALLREHGETVSEIGQIVPGKGEVVYG